MKYAFAKIMAMVLLPLIAIIPLAASGLVVFTYFVNLGYPIFGVISLIIIYLISIVVAMGLFSCLSHRWIT